MARAQTGWVRARLEAAGVAAPEVLVTTQGDTSRAALTSFGGQGVFVAAVRQAVVDGRADLAVHSMKDMPTAPDPDTVVAAVPVREDTRDFVVSRAAGLADLPAGAREGALDAVVVAAAGLHRLGLQPDGFLLDEDVMLPAVGQGALSLEMRGHDERAQQVATLDDPGARAEVVAERALLAGLRAGSAAPDGARAHHERGRVRQAAQDLIGQGAGRLLGENR